MRRALATHAVILFAAFAALADTEESGVGVGPNPAHAGYALYQQLCSRCHGVSADGHGPEAANLSPPPTDLTRLRVTAGGPPRREELVRAIDGRRTIRAHGAGEMPVWGWILASEESDPQRREQARAQLVKSLADYVLSIQRVPDEKGTEAPE